MKRKKSDRIACVAYYVVFAVLFLIALITLAQIAAPFTQQIRSLFTQTFYEHPFMTFIFLGTVGTLATFRLTRLITSDSITKPFRTWIEEQRNSGLALALRGVFFCPWCASMWSSLCVLALFLIGCGGVVAESVSILFILVLALSGLSSLVFLFANRIGWTAEKKKLQAHLLQKKL